MNKWAELLLGLILVIGSIIGAFASKTTSWNFLSAAKVFFMGGLFWLVVLVGVLFILLGISDLKSK